MAGTNLLALDFGLLTRSVLFGHQGEEPGMLILDTFPVFYILTRFGNFFMKLMMGIR